ncbi:hypothetical protein [Jiella mangrovi]|uniref:Lipoprotein n=1 Tax=Jiella mangrovi TaxID=2821407 RepID=A0ABS4BLC8_9HYPH|nr:hypothetical protein [Jiella mangrovi]MBP0617516.1 hypothetical protein [Jiella mangrovi]
MRDAALLCHAHQFGATRWRMMLSAITFTLAALMTSGCTFGPQISQGSIAYNKALETSANSLTLLNIVRSAYQMPMYFSRFRQINGRLSSTVNSGATGNLSFSQAAGLGNYVINPSLSSALGSSPDFTVEPLDTMEFYQGMLRPISPATFQYFWESGWPKPLLIHLLVAKVEVEDAAKHRCIIENYVPNKDKHAYFVAAVRAFLANKPSLEVVSTKSSKFGPRLPVTGDGILQGLVEASRAGFSVPSDQPSIQLEKQRFSYSIVGRTATGKPMELSLGGEANKDPRGQIKFCHQRPEALSLSKAKITLRSMNQILYFLGEIVRVQLPDTEGSHYLPTIMDSENGDLVPIFRVQPGGSGLVSVEYRGQTYSVPSGPAAGRSYSVLGLVQLLFGLSLNAKDLPQVSPIILAN